MFTGSLRFLACLTALTVFVSKTSADFIQISSPTAPYTSSTTVLNMTSVGSGSSGTSFPQPPQTITSNTLLTKWTVGVPFGYTFWGSPPNTETSQPDQLITDTSTTSITLSLATPENTFGFELQGNPANPVSTVFNITFFDVSNSVVGSFPISISANSTSPNPGARLVAATSNTNPFIRATIVAPGGFTGGFGVAQVRWGAAVVPEPASIALMAQAAIGLGFVAYRRRRRQA